MTDKPANNLWRFLEVLARRRGLIIGLTLLGTATAVVVSLLLPIWFTASALLMPPSDGPRAIGLADLAQIDVLTGGTRVPGMITQNDVYARMLGSRRVSDAIIEKYNLRERFGVSTRAALYKTLANRVKVRVTDEGMLNILVEDRDPQVAAAITTSYVEELTRLNRELLSTAAREKREFIEARLGETETKLQQARDDLQRFQLENRAVNFDEQTRLAVDQAVQLKITEAALELEIDMDSRQLGEENPNLLDKRQRLGVIRSQLRQLEWGGPDSSFFSMPVSAVPELRGRYESLLTLVRVSESQFQTLLELLEQARIQEKEEGPTVVVLDWPDVPDLRSRPQRSLIVIGAFACTFIFATVFAMFLEFVRRLKEERSADYDRLVLFANAFFGWLPGVRRKVPQR
jgi:tyrosine-protein kinase Etk/Wzc